MVFCAAEPEKRQMLIRRNVKWLESVQITSGDRKGVWPYGAQRDVDPVYGDNSNTQFAVLALHEAERAGVEVSDPVGGWPWPTGSTSRSKTAPGTTIPNNRRLAV